MIECSRHTKSFLFKFNFFYFRQDWNYQTMRQKTLHGCRRCSRGSGSLSSCKQRPNQRLVFDPSNCQQFLIRSCIFEYHSLEIDLWGTKSELAVQGCTLPGRAILQDQIRDCSRIWTAQHQYQWYCIFLWSNFPFLMMYLAPKNLV